MTTVGIWLISIWFPLMWCNHAVGIQYQSFLSTEAATHSLQAWIPTEGSGDHFQKDENLHRKIGEPMFKDGHLKNNPQKQLLAFFAVGDLQKAINSTMRNIHHLRMHFHDKIDIFLAHYGNRSSWPPDWYRNNVDFSISSSGYKMQLLNESIRRRDQIDNYQWVWALDEDVDVTQINLPRMLKLLNTSKALIAGPSILFPVAAASHSTSNSSDLILFNASANTTDRTLEEMTCQSGDRRCSLQAPRKECSYRYTNIVENIAPIFRPAVLWLILHECEHCLHPKSSWGLMDIWCSMSKRKFGLDFPEQKSACVVLDETTLIHKNFKTLGKYLASGLEDGDVRREYKKEKNDVKKNNLEDFVQPEEFKTLECVPRNSTHVSHS